MPSRRTGHWVKQTKAGYGPRCVVSVVVEPLLHPSAPESAQVVPSACGRIFAAWRRQTRGAWCAVQERVFDTPLQFWTWLERWTFKGRRAYVFAPVASDVLTLAGFWHRVQQLGGTMRGQLIDGPLMRGTRGQEAEFRFDRLVLRGKPDIVQYSLRGKRYTWLSLSQYWSCAESQLIRSVGGSWPCARGTERPDPNSSLSTPQRCTLQLSAMLQLVGWWTPLKAGGFGPTIGALALSFVRRRMPKKSVCTHNDERVQKLERLACHGGRASLWYYGDVRHRSHDDATTPTAPPATSPWHLDEMLTQVDVSSMYPHIMSTIDMPTRLLSYSYTETPATLRDLLRCYCVVANVQLDTPEAEYPHRSGQRVIYPTGRFNAVLCGDELRAALDRKHVHAVVSAAIYASGRPFAAAAAELLEMRSAAKLVDDPGWEQFVKLLANSVTGKLAQRCGCWVARPKKGSEQDWGEWPEVNGDTGVITRYRAMAGMVWEYVRDMQSPGTWAACYAHITSAGRARMRSLRELCPPRSVTSQDTDGLWVTAAGRRALLAAGALQSAGPGHLRHVASTTRGRWYSPKHYWTTHGWTLAGLHSPQHLAGTLTFFDEWTSNLARSSSPTPPDTIHLHTREVSLSVLDIDGTVGRDGWHLPTELPRRTRHAQQLHDDRVASQQHELPDMG